MSCCVDLRRVVSYRNSTSNHNSRAAGTISAGLYLIEILHQTTTWCLLRLLWWMLYLIEILHQTTTPISVPALGGMLYLIEILHQTTTSSPRMLLEVLLYLIEILHQTTTHQGVAQQRTGLYLIEILHQTTTALWCWNSKSCCILSKFYIKPQHVRCQVANCPCCILSKFYIKPQPLGWCTADSYRCILSKFYIKPQPPLPYGYVIGVVSYRNSTSNHNASRRLRYIDWLYLIEILHQTTTA